MKKIALFDIDKTLIPYDSFLKWIFRILKKNPRGWLRLPWIILRSCNAFLSPEKLTRCKERWLSLANGLSENELKEISLEMIHSCIIPDLKPGAKETVQQYKKAGYLIILATASFELYFSYLAEYLQADYFFGTPAICNNSKWSIPAANCKGEEKIRRILALLSEREIDREHSVGYSDSMTDYPFTHLVKDFCLVDKKHWKTVKHLSTC